IGKAVLFLTVEFVLKLKSPASALAVLQAPLISRASMRALAIRPRFTHPWLKSSTFRAFSSSSSNYSNQSRGGLPRFFSPVLPPSKALSHSGGTVRVEGDEFWHMTKVLRLSTQDRVELFNGKGGLIKGCIQNIDRIGLDFLALEDPKIVHPQTTQWHVFAAFGSLKGGRADWLVEKCTELGASSITPLLTERSPSISDNRVGRLQRVILAAAKQCQRLHEMDLHPPVKVGGLLPIRILKKALRSYLLESRGKFITNFTISVMTCAVEEILI
ncbi:unnamed protein product, partial [Thlaspi arvense]